MRITEFSIDNYGPLVKTGSIQTGAFNLFFGKNENGKTLTIDALIKFLVGKRAKDFKQADRVDGMPDGYLKVLFNESAVDKEKKEKSLPYDGDLPKVTKNMSFPITASDCRNIFIIRNSDLTLSGEAEFYTDVTERLVGLRTHDLKKIRRNLLEIGKLTPALDFKNDEKSLRLKNRIENAEKLIGKIENIKGRLLDGKYDKLEIDLYKKNKELSGVNEKLMLYEDAGKRAMFEKSSGLLENLEEKISVLKDMEIVKEDGLDEWQEAEREIKRSGREIGELQQKADDIKKNISTVREQIKDLKQKLDIINAKKRSLDDEKINLRGLENTLSETDSDSSLRALLKRVSIFASIITILIIIIWFFNPSKYIYYTGIVSLFITLLLWIYEISLISKKRRVLKEFGRIKLSLAENRINGDTIEAILNALAKFNEDYENIRTKNMELEAEASAHQRHMKETEEKIQSYKSVIDESEKKILHIKTKSGYKTLLEYSEALKAKRNKEKEKDGLASRLEGMLGIHGKSMGETLSMIKVKITGLEIYKEKGRGFDFNQKIYDDLKNNCKSIEEEIKDINGKISQFEIGMAGIEAEANEILFEKEERLFCRTLVDLDEIYNRLHDFIDGYNNSRRAITGALQILDEIGSDEDERVFELFEGNSAASISGLFNTITDGSYNKVICGREEQGMVLRVIRSNGEAVDAEKLSGGAYDQLYLAIRLALGKKLLQSGKGFFIMDDPFIKSDIERIGRQMNVLKKICNMGWQILYFSCKNEIKDILSNDIKRGYVSLIDINWIKN